MSPYKRGDVWYVEVPAKLSPTRKRRRERSEARTKAEAALLEAELRVAGDRAKKHLAPGSLNPERLTLLAAAKRYLKKMHGRASYGTQRHNVNKHIDRSGLGELLLEHVTGRMLDDYIDEHTKTPATANHIRSLFSAIFRVAKKQKAFFGENPVTDIETRPVSDQTKDEIPADLVLALLENAPDADWKLFFALAVYTGMRKGEIRRLDLDHDVDLKRRIITVRISKTRVKKRVGLHKDLISLIEAAKLRGFVLGSRTWQKAARYVRETAPGARSHDLRSTWASRMVDCGADSFVVDFMAWGKKKSSVFRSRYLEYPDARLVAEIDKLTWPKADEAVATTKKASIA